MINSRSFLLVFIGISCLFIVQTAVSQTAHIAPPAVSVAAPNGHVAPPAATYRKGAEIQASKYDCGDPTAEEQYVIELINRARADPKAEGDRLSTTQDGGIVNNLKFYTEPTRAQIKAEFATYPVVPPLACNPKLLAMARAHSQNMLDNGYQGHDGPDGPFPDRFRNSGYPQSAGGENVFDYGTDGWDIHANFQYDFGNYPTIGHRTNIMNMDGNIYTEVGIGIIDGTNGSLGPKFTTENFGGASQHFILGVVYNDANKNNFYDIGEGVSGIKIETGGSYYAVSSTSGGYAIPYSGSGTVSVKATGGAFGTTGTTQMVSFDGENVKVDFLVNGLPGSVVLEAPGSQVGGSTAKFMWQAQTGATHYHLQVGTDSAMTKSKLIVNDSTSLTGTTTSKTVTGLKDSMVYYWRMRAQNSKGWGSFGPVQSFTVYLPLPTVTLVSPANGEMVDPDNATLVWNRSGARASNYMVEVSASSSMTSLVDSQVIQADVDGSSIDSFYTVPVGKLQGNKTYYWRVLVQNEGPWSAPQAPVHNFITGASDVAESSIDRTVTLSPNPSSGVAHFRFELDQPKDVLCKIYNNVGDVLRTYRWGVLSASVQDMTIDASDLPAGNYGYVLHLGEQVRMGRLVVVK